MFQVPGIYIYIHIFDGRSGVSLLGVSAKYIYIYIFEIYVGKIVIGHVIGAD